MNRRDLLTTGSAATAFAILPRMAAAQAAGGAAKMPGDATLDAAFDTSFRQAVANSPELATSLGFDKGPGAPLKHRLSDRSAAGKAANLARTRTAAKMIRDIAPDTLSPTARLNREVVLYSLDQQLVGPDKLGVDSPVRPFTITQQGGAYFSVPDFLDSAHVIATAEDAEAYLDRTTAFAKALDDDTTNQREAAAKGIVAPGFSLELALGQLKKLRGVAPAENSLTRSIARRTAAKQIAGDWQGRCAKIVADAVYPALDRQIALVETLLKTPRTTAGVGGIPNGAAIYAAALEASTTTRYTPEEVHQMGLQQVAEISAELDKILKAQGLTKGSVGDRLTALNAQSAQLYPDTAEGRTALIASLNADVKRMQGLLPKAFDNPPNAPLDIRAVPVEIQDGASNGYYNRAALDGSRPAIYWINLKSVADWPKYSLPALTWHEGTPGHHLQITIAQNAPTPILRKLVGFGAYSEGWALYAEQVADEIGAYQSPLERAGFLQSYLFRAARLVVDTGIHAKGWSREKATDYLVATTGFARPRSQREVERYCTQAGQACSYKIGHVAWVRARARAQKMLGAKFDLKTFHKVLDDGAVPLTILDRLVDDRARAQMA